MYRVLYKKYDTIVVCEVVRKESLFRTSGLSVFVDGFRKRSPHVVSGILRNTRCSYYYYRPLPALRMNRSGRNNTRFHYRLNSILYAPARDTRGRLHTANWFAISFNNRDISFHFFFAILISLFPTFKDGVVMCTAYIYI